MHDEIRDILGLFRDCARKVRNDAETLMLNRTYDAKPHGGK